MTEIDDENKAERVNKNRLKRNNRRVVLQAFRNTAILTVSEIADATGLSKPTVHRAVEYLRGRNLVLTAGKGASTDEGGKKPTLLTLNARYKHILAFHIMAQGLLSGISDMQGKLLAETSVAFPYNTSLDTILAEMRKAAETMTADLRIDYADFAGVVIGGHGVTDADQGVIEGSPCYPVWGTKVPFQSLVADLFPVPLPVYMDNSNRYSAYAEMRTGAARNHKSFLVVDGEAEGLGAGLVLDGVLWHGGHCMAGEIGHMVVDPAGTRVCHCGARGCLETVACVASLVRGAKEGFSEHRDSLLFSRMQPGEVSYIDIYDIANAGDEFAQSLVDVQARWLAIGVVNVTLAADPDLVILQGPYARGGEYLLDRLVHHMSQFAHPRLKRYPEVIYSRFGRERVLVGGSHYVADRYYSAESLYE